MVGEGDRVWEENIHVDQLDSDSKPIETVVRLKRRRGRPRKGENAGKNEGLLLNQGLHRLPATSLELRKRPRKGKRVAGSTEEEEEVRQQKIQLPITFTDTGGVKGTSFLPTLWTCKTVGPSETGNQNPAVSTKLGDQSITEYPILLELDINEHAANLVTESHGSGDQCRTNPNELEFIADNHQPKEEKAAYSPSNTNKEDASKSKQSGGCQSSSYISPNLSQMCLLMDEDPVHLDEISSRSCEAFVSVNGYEVKAELAPILRDIFIRHGDIAKDCTFRAVKSRSRLLENVCEIYKRMEGANFVLLTPVELKSLLEEVGDLKTTKIELGWLHYRLVEIMEAKDGINTLKEEKKRTAEAIERRKQELVSDKKQLEVLIKKINENDNALAVLEAEEEKLHEKFNNMKYTLKLFHRKSLVYGLL